MDQQSPDFDLDKYTWLLEAIVTDLEYIQYHDYFLDFCRETTKIFMQMGGILKVAFEDITTKCRIIDDNYKMHKDIHEGLINFILLEKSMNVHTLNGENSDHLKNTEQAAYYRYESTARTMLRLMWFLDFVYHLLVGLLNEPNKGLGSICQNSYNIALGPNHPMTIRLAVRAGLLTVGGRDGIYKILFRKQEDPKVALLRMSEAILKIKTRLWDLYDKEQLRQLP